MRRGLRGLTCGLVVLVGFAPTAEIRANEGPGDGPELPTLVLLAPGTRVDGKAPEEWTDRVIRSVPRLASGEIATLPESAKGTATLFRTAILADVASGAEGYRLRAVGIGNAVPSGGRERVVTPEGPAEIRASLSAVERIVANLAHRELARGRLVARTPTFALLRSPARLVVEGAHEAIDLHYAILADPKSGRLSTLSWVTRAGRTSPPDRIAGLPSDLAFDCGLDVAVNGRIGPIPVSWSFAMTAPPPGRPLDLSPEAARLVEADASGRGDPVALEGALRALIATR